MKAAVLHAKDDIRYEEWPTPKPKTGEVLVRVRACGICGSDLPRVLGDGAHFFPIVLGHEFSGEIAEIGEGVEGFSIGERVAGAPLKPCLACSDCQTGDYALCKHYSFIGSREQGAFAEYVAIPARNAVKFGDSIPFEQGALFEPSTVSLHALLLTRFEGGKRVAIIGCGTIGLFAGQWAKILGAREIVAFDIDGDKLSLAKKLFADEAYLSGSDEAGAAGGFDYVFDAVGGQATLIQSLTLAGGHAVVCLIGTPTRDTLLTAKQMELINRKELWLTGSWMSYSAPFPGPEWEMTAHYYGAGLLKHDPDIFHGTFPLANVREAFDLYKKPGGAKGRVLLIP